MTKYPQRLAGLSASEVLACRIAESTLGTTAEPWGVNGRQGAVDAILHLKDGSQAAFEVTTLSGTGALQTESVLARDDFRWPTVGAWTWSISVGSPRDIPRLRLIYAKVADLCERNGVTRPEELVFHAGQSDVDPDLTWLVCESGSDMIGYPSIPNELQGGQRRSTAVLPAGRGGGVDDELDGLPEALAEAFDQRYIKAHLRKLLAFDCKERHLFIHLHSSALQFDVIYGLMNGTACPTSPPPLVGISHLWLAPQYSDRVLVWSAAGWTQHFPYNTPSDRREKID